MSLPPDSVSLLLTPDPESSQVLLVRRHPDLTFLGGFWAFPGGTVEEEDRRQASTVLCDPPDGEELAPFILAGAREVFEETGLWIPSGPHRLEPGRLQELRRAMNEGRGFAQLVREEGFCLNSARFQPVCRITTPPFFPRRFHTLFLLAQCEQPALPELSGELDAALWVTAEEALEYWKNGSWLIAPPVLRLLQELENQSLRSFLPRARQVAASYGEGSSPRICFSCGVVTVPLRTRTRPPAAYTNSYLVGDRRLYLVDPGADDPAELERLWRITDGLLAEGRQLEAVVLTHHHADHVGGSGAARERYKVPVLAHPETEARAPGLQVDTLLAEGQRLDLGDSPDGRSDWHLQVFHTPGHAAGHLILRDSRYGALIAGDMVSTLSSILVDPKEGELAVYLDSLRRLEGLAGGILYPGHGPPARDGRALVRAALLHRLSREAQILDQLRAQPKTLEELLQSVYPSLTEPLRGLAGRSLLAHLIKLRQEGRVEQLGDLYRPSPGPP